MSSFDGDDHSVSHVLGLLEPEEPFQYRPKASDQEMEETPFRIVYQTSRFAMTLAPMPILARIPIQAFTSPVGIPSTISRVTILHLQKIYGISNHIRIFVPDLSDRGPQSRRGNSLV